MPIRALAMSVYALALGVWIVVVGLPSDPFQMFVWLWLAAIAWYAGAPWSEHTRFVRDWWPAFAVLILYLYSRGLSDELIGMPVHWTMPIEVDRWMFGGHLPTEVLQDRLCGDPCLRSTEPRWYDIVLTTVYFSHFVLGLGLAFVLWIRDRAAWAAWLTRYLTINVAGLVIYILYPMAPPWLASKERYIGEALPRLTGRGWEVIGLDGFHVVLASVGNPVAAMPSLHCGIAALVAFWLIARLRSPWRWLILLYPATMGFALVYYAEHYVIDLIAGWALAGLVMVAVGRWERRRARTGVTQPARSPAAR
ncbi:MAG: phosphatase PAP2 family protein [Aeromicrobium sp.]|uniref:phosphatase PAP2 family protein n=1 Tax=Aeromicrobium sp. TaxID=1871063 RepID=UPI002603094E|nr:phosphatase PAP2 family protein [Aeromicrobium sp.]MDF1705994.1 phosphatase PAP2 family protein [Aeromicrobium sp.]